MGYKCAILPQAQRDYQEIISCLLMCDEALKRPRISWMSSIDR